MMSASASQLFSPNATLSNSANLALEFGVDLGERLQKAQFIPNEYDKVKELERAERKAAREKFVGPGSVKTGLPGLRRHRGTFSDFDLFPEPYELHEMEPTVWFGTHHGHKDAVHRTIRSSGNQVPDKHFNTGGCTRDKRQKMRASSSQARKQIQQELSDRWAILKPVVKENPSGHFICRFQLSPDDKLMADVLNFMRRFVKSHEVITNYALRKEAFHWNVIVDGRVEFALRPPCMCWCCAHCV